MADQLVHSMPPSLGDIDLSQFDRIVFTGMGSSHYASIPIEQQLISRGYPVWRVDEGRLLGFPELVTPHTLFVATSQSGMTGEIIALLERLSGSRRPRTIIGITNNEQSALAHACDVLIALKSGHEATVSSKSYLNSLVALQRVSLALFGQEET